MTNLTDEDVAAALENCAAEPLRIPGHVQPFGCILVCDAGSGAITQVSENAAELLDLDPSALVGQDLANVLGRNLWHDVNGVLAGSGASQMARSAGEFVRGDTRLHVSAYQTGDRICVELQTPPSRQLNAGDALRTMIYLSQQVMAAKSQDSLHKGMVETLRHITGYERVMVYKFDDAFNGEVIAEARAPRMNPLIGLRFPHWDIPPQARAVMAELPLRVIADVNASPADLITAQAEPPLDLTRASCRGVAPIHMQYLRNIALARP